MKQKLPYQITDNLYALGHDLFITYLVKGNPCVLLDLGVSGTVPLINHQLKELGVEASDIGFLVVLHAHWDHVCGLPYLQQLFPSATVVGSAKALQILDKPNIVDQFRRNDELYCSQYKEKLVFKELPPFLNYKTLAVDKVIADGEIISLGDINIQFHATPGHSPCTLSAYLPSEKATIISDAVGCYVPQTDEVLPLFFQSVKMTLDSLEKLKTLEANIVANCHDTEMIFIGTDNISHAYRRIEEEILKLVAEIKQMTVFNRPQEEMLNTLFQAAYTGFLTEMYPPDYLKGVVPYLLKAINEES
jgi:glyoxylase-like metal-dependent hydrolase (beta-lactamase superfamily II)